MEIVFCGVCRYLVGYIILVMQVSEPNVVRINEDPPLASYFLFVSVTNFVKYWKLFRSILIHVVCQPHP